MSEAPDRVASQSETGLGAAEIGVGQEEPLRADERPGLQEQTQGDVITLRSPAGVFGYVSPASPATLGWDLVELIGLMADDFVHPEDLPAARACRNGALGSPMPVISTYRFRCKDGVAGALSDHDLPAGSLLVEVTERVVMEGSNSAMDCLRTIRALGVPVGLDDFGTGYSPLAYLRQFPLDFVKIDGSFVQQLGATPETVAIVTAIIGLAHGLHLWVVAEGVETDQQLRMLVELGCDRAQGFLFGPADEAETVAAVIERRSVDGPALGRRP